MRVGFLTASLSRNAGGVYESTRMLAISLQRAGLHELTAFGLRDAHTVRDSSGWASVRTCAYPAKGPESFGYSLALSRRLKLTELDLLHTHGLWMYPSWASLDWAKSTNKPYIVSPHGMLDQWALNNSRWKKKLALFLYESAHLHGASCLHALCTAEADSMRSFGLRNPICIVPNGIELPNRLTDDTPPLWAGQLPTGARALLYLGRIHPKKGLVNLLRAWRTAKSGSVAGSVWVLVVAGWDQDGHEAELKSLAKSLRIDKEVFFVGPQFDHAKSATFRNASGFILPSLSEGLPMVVLEAWAYQLPVLMTPYCNLPRGFESKAAIRIGTDPSSIATALKSFFELADTQRKEIGKRGEHLVSEEFSWPRLSREMLDVYRWLLGQSERPKCVTLD